MERLGVVTFHCLISKLRTVCKGDGLAFFGAPTVSLSDSARLLNFLTKVNAKILKLLSNRTHYMRTPITSLSPLSLTHMSTLSI